MILSLIKPAHAIVCNPLLDPNCSNSQQVNQPDIYVNKILQTGISIFLIFGVLMFVYYFFNAAFNFINSRGDAKKVEEARHELSFALVGLVIAFGIFAILKIIGLIFGIPNLQNLTLTWPSLL